MVLKLKDIYKLATHIEDFLKKLDSDSECAVIRDTLNLSLLNLQRYYKSLASRIENISSVKFVIIDKYSWKWKDLPNKRFSTRLPVLLQAIKNKNADEVREHLRGNISNICDSIGRNAMFYTVHYFSEDIFNIIFEAKIDINESNYDGQNALHLACKEGNLLALKELMRRGADAYLSDDFGRTAMHWSIVASNLSCLEYLLGCGYVSSKCIDYEGMTPAMWAAHLSRVDHLKLLLENNALNEDKKIKTSGDGKDTERDQYGRMWIHWCVHNSGSQTCLKEYLNDEVLRIRDNLGRSVVHVAAEKGSIDAMKVICSIADNDIIEERDSFDRTPLIIAVIGGHGELTNHLLSMKADILKVDKFGASAWDYARSNQLHYCMLIIASYLCKTTDQNPLLDIASSINFNQSMRLSLSRSKSIDLYHNKEMTNVSSELKMSQNSFENNEHLSKFDPHPPNTPNISRNFRRQTLSPREVSNNTKPITSKLHEEKIKDAVSISEIETSKNMGLKDDISQKIMNKISKRHVIRQKVAAEGRSSSDEKDHDHGRYHHRCKTQNNPSRKWTKIDTKMTFAGLMNDGNNYGEHQETHVLPNDFASHEADQRPLQNYFKISSEKVVNGKNIATNSSQKKVNFKFATEAINNNDNNSSEDEDHSINVCNLVAKERFAKWDVNFSGHESEHVQEQNKKEMNSGEYSSYFSSTNHLTDNAMQRIEQTNIKSKYDEEFSKRIPKPAPRRISKVESKAQQSD